MVWNSGLYRGVVLLDLAKIIVEAVTGNSLFTDPATLGAAPVPLAHALGFVAGWLLKGNVLRGPASYLALALRSRSTRRFMERPSAVSLLATG